MPNLIQVLPTWLLCLLVIIVALSIAMIALFIFRKSINHDILKQNHDVAGIMFGAVGLIYSLILAFVIVAVWNDYEAANDLVSHEADDLSSIQQYAGELPDSLGTPIQQAVKDFSQTLVQNQWGTTKQAAPNQVFRKLRHTLFKMHPAKESQQKVLNLVDDQIKDALDTRRALIGYRQARVPALVWLVLLTGTTLTIFCSFLFFVQPAKMHYLFVGLLTCMIAMSLFLVYMLDNPFAGGSAVPSTQIEKFYQPPPR
jgi:hypothetical protein